MTVTNAGSGTNVAEVPRQLRAGSPARGGSHGNSGV
jgi:hypothetical protein